VADVLCLTSLLAACSDPPGFRGLPVFLLGSSMGGNLALHAAMQQVGATCLRG
jgi:alpha-beta hydrolase superfamily lysophospholipase